MAVPKEAEPLYDLPPEEFTRGRDALAKELKAAGDPETAAEVRALRRPTVAAWAVNAAARSQTDRVRELLEVGDELATAQRAALKGGGRSPLHEVAGRRRDLVATLTEAARGALDESGRSSAGSSMDEITNTLLAVATDQEGADRVRRGVLDRPLALPSGFGDLDVVDFPGKPPRRPRSRKGEAKAEDALARRRKEQALDRARVLAAKADQAEKEAAGLEREAKEAEAQAGRARRAADRAATGARRAREQADRATEKAEGLGGET